MLLQVEVNNWLEYNPRSDRKVYTWFRFQNDFFMNHKIHGLSDISKLVWIFILCEASKNFGKAVNIETFLTATLLRKNDAEVVESIQELTRLGVITVTNKTPNGNSTNDTNERTIRTNDTNGSNSLRSLLPPQSAPPPCVGAIDEFSSDSVCRDLLKDVSAKAQRAWLEVYPDAEWLEGEIRKAHAWIASNPRRAPKQMARFLANWFSRAYESYRKSQPVNSTTATRNADVLRDMHRRVKEGKL